MAHEQMDYDEYADDDDYQPMAMDAPVANEDTSLSSGARDMGEHSSVLAVDVGGTADALGRWCDAGCRGGGIALADGTAGNDTAVKTLQDIDMQEHSDADSVNSHPHHAVNDGGSWQHSRYMCDGLC